MATNIDLSGNTITADSFIGGVALTDIPAVLTGTVTGTADGVLEDIAATAAACAGGATPSATQVDTAVALAVSTIVTGLNLQVKELMTKVNALIVALNS